MNTIQIKGLKLETVIGVHAWERKLPRVILLDLDLATDTRRAAKSDAIKDALDYQAVADATIKFAEASRFQLIETFAEKLAERLITDFGVEWLRITVHKPGAVAAAQSVSVTIEHGTKR